MPDINFPVALSSSFSFESFLLGRSTLSHVRNALDDGIYYCLSYVSSATPSGPTTTRSPSCAGRIHTGIPGPISTAACRSFSVSTSRCGFPTNSPIVTYSSWDTSCANPVRYVRPASTLLTVLTASAIPKCDVCGFRCRQSSARTGIDLNSGHTSSGMNDTSEM